MSNSYAARLPLDEAGNLMQEFPSAVPALVTTAAVTPLSSVVAFGNNSTSIEIAAPQGAAIKWIAIGAAQTSVISSYAATANFDHIIPAGTYRRFVIPRETQGVNGPLGAGSVNGLYQRLAIAPIATLTSSILVTEY